MSAVLPAQGSYRRAPPRPGVHAAWRLSPAGWTLAAAAVVFELGTGAGWWPPLGTLGTAHLPASAVPAVGLVVLQGRRLFSSGCSWLVFFACAGVTVAVPAWQYRELFGGAAGVTGFALAALREEVVFRAALPLLVAQALGGVGRPPGWSRVGALVIPAALFAVQPSHLHQAASALDLVPFFTFALFFGLLVRRPDVLLPAALAHLAVNLLTVPVAHGFVSPSARGVAVAVLLAGFAWTALWASTDDPVTGAGQVSTIS